jgi:glycosyltransferase involved in cell wall biosynthesis
MNPMSKPLVVTAMHKYSDNTLASLRLAFESTDTALRKHASVRRMPNFYYIVPKDRRIGVGRQALRNADFVLTHGMDAFMLREELGLRCRILLHLLGGLPRGGIYLRRLLPYLRTGDQMIVTSTADLKILHNLVESCRAETSVVPFGVDIRKIQPLSSRRRRQLRSQAGLDDRDVLFLYLGRVTAEKNVQDVLTTLEGVMGQQPEVQLLVAGPVRDVQFAEFGTGPVNLNREFQRIIEGSRYLRGRVRFVPWVTRELLPSLYGIADVFVNLTVHHDENFGYAQVEAMSAGLPVVCTHWGGLKDTVRHGITGFHVPTLVGERGVQVERPQALQACRELASSGELRRQMGAAGRQHACAMYGMDRFADNLGALFRRQPASSADRNDLTAFGKAYDQQFSEVDAEGRSKPIPPVYTEATYPLYRKLIEPYATGPSPMLIEAHGCVYLHPSGFALDDHTIDIKEPLWPRRVSISPLELAVIQRLTEEAKVRSQFMDVQKLRAEVASGEPERLFACLGRLVQQGVIGWSNGVAGARAQDGARQIGAP